MNARRLLVPVVLAACVLSGCGGSGPDGGRTKDAPAPVEEPKPLTIAIAGMVTSDEGLDYYLGLSEYVGKKAGREVRLIHKADYAEVNDLLRYGKVDVAFVCSGPYTIGHDEFGLQLIAAPVVNGAPSYYSYIIVPRSSTATALASLRDKTFAFTDPGSNTGYTVPRFMLVEAGVSPKSFFRETFLTYSHSNSIEAVATGKADGAAVDSLIWDYENATDPSDTSRTRVIEKSEPFAIPPVVARPGLDSAVVSAVRDALLTAHEDAEGKALLDNMKIERFVVVEDSAYDSIRRMNERIAE